MTSRVAKLYESCTGRDFEEDKDPLGFWAAWFYLCAGAVVDVIAIYTVIVKANENDSRDVVDFEFITATYILVGFAALFLLLYVMVLIDLAFGFLLRTRYTQRTEPYHWKEVYGLRIATVATDFILTCVFLLRPCVVPTTVQVLVAAMLLEPIIVNGFKVLVKWDYDTRVVGTLMFCTPFILFLVSLSYQQIDNINLAPAGILLAAQSFSLLVIDLGVSPLCWPFYFAYSFCVGGLICFSLTASEIVSVDFCNFRFFEVYGLLLYSVFPILVLVKVAVWDEHHPGESYWHTLLRYNRNMGALHLATTADRVHFLVSEGADIEERTQTTQNSDNPKKGGLTPLHVAWFTFISSFRKGGLHTEVINALIDLGADVNAVSSDGRSVVFHAVDGLLVTTHKRLSHRTEEGLQVFRSMVDRGADLSVTCNDETVLFAAVRGSHSASVTGSDAPFVVTEEAYRSILQTLLDLGADPNARGKHGDTPLHVASRHGDPVAIRVLLENGADPTLLNDDGKTAEGVVRRQWFKKDTATVAALNNQVVPKTEKEEEEEEYGV